MDALKLVAVVKCIIANACNSVGDNDAFYFALAERSFANTCHGESQIRAGDLYVGNVGFFYQAGYGIALLVGG